MYVRIEVFGHFLEIGKMETEEPEEEEPSSVDNMNFPHVVYPERAPFVGFQTGVPQWEDKFDF